MVEGPVLGEASGGGPGRELFGTRIGFVLAAAGSAVGLGNMWRFPYQTAEGGGAAFVLLYLLMTFLIGAPIMAAEFALGRRSRLSPIGALRKLGGAAWAPLGWLMIVTPLVILAYFSVISGWALRYALDAFTGFSASPAERYAGISTGLPAIQFHLVLMFVTFAVVVGGVRKGIERASLVLMPTLFAILVGLALWASTLPGAKEGYSFYLSPNLDALLNPSVFQQAASQAFLSLSVGMGIMITYGSYLPSNTSLCREAALVSLFDFSVAFVAGLIVFPVIFALDLVGEVGSSTIGALFISLPGAFHEMGAAGRVVALVFFVALVMAGLTSSFSLLEVGTASLMDQLKLSRPRAAAIAAVGAAIAGIPAALSQETLGLLDKVVGELFVVGGVLGMAVLVGWRMKNPGAELEAGASARFRSVVPPLMFLLRYVIPPLIAVILCFSLADTIDLVLTMGLGGQ